jgi:hypothetical protein
MMAAFLLGVDAFGAAILATSASGWTSLVSMGPANLHTPVCAKVDGETKLCGFIRNRWGDKVIVQWTRRVPGQKAVPGLLVKPGDDPSIQMSESPTEMGSLALENEAASFMFGISSPGSTSKTTSFFDELPIQFHVAVGANFLAGVFSLQGSVSNKVAIGLTPSFYPLAKLGLTNDLLGGFVSVHYFASELWKGPWIQLAGGYFTGETLYRNVTGKQGGPCGLITLGYRLRAGDFTLGLGAGAQYLQLSKTDTLNFTYKSLSPTFWIDLGYIL